MSDDVTGIVRFKLGGVEHSAKLTLRDMPEVEAACNRGVLELIVDAAHGRVRLTDVCEVLRTGLARQGQAYTRDELLGLMEYEGALSFVKIFERLLSPVLKPAGAKSSGKSQARQTAN